MILKNHLYSLPSILWVFSISILINFDGFYKLIDNGYSKVGSFNIILAVILLVILFFTLSLIKNDLLINKKLLAYFLSVIIIIITFTLSALNNSDYLKYIRDITYIISFFYYNYFFFYVFKNKNKKIKNIIINFIYFNLIVLSFIGILLNNYATDGRFYGMQLVSSIYGNFVALLFISAVENIKSKKINFLLFLLTVILIFLSGTRGAFLLIIVYFIFKAFNQIKNLNKYIKTLLYFILFLSIPLFFVLMNSLLEMSSHTEIRVLSSSDMENGSLMTRLYWYKLLLDDLVNSYFIGGYGAGAAENKIGYITHFDFLRFWFDYSLFSVLALVSSLYFYCKAFNSSFSAFVLCISLLLLLSFHNIFQAPMLLFIFSFMMVSILSNDKKLSEQVC